MKRFLLVVLGVAIALSSAVCDSKLIGVAMPTQSLQRWNQDGANMKAQLEAKGYQVELQYANNDVNTQVQQLENMITKRCKVLVIASIDGSALSNVLKEAKENNIKVIAYDRLIMSTPNVDYYATFDNFKVGVIQGQFIESKLGLKSGKGPFNIELFAGSPDDNNATFFNKGAMSILQPYLDSGKLVVPSGQKEFTTIAIQAWDSGKSQARMDNLITASYSKGKKLDAILSPNDSLAIGINAEFKKEGRDLFTAQDMQNIRDSVNGAFGRPHIAAYMITKGIVQDTQEAFERYLIKCDVPKYPLSLPEASQLIHQAGGVLVLAHGNDRGGTSLGTVTKDLRQQTRIIGENMIEYINGLEIWHPGRRCHGRGLP